MRCIFLNRFYRPDEHATAQLLRDLAEACAAAEIDVTVIASSPRSERMAPRIERLDRVTIHRVGGISAGQNGIARKAWEICCYMVAATHGLWQLARRGDVVIALTDPPLLCVAVTLVGRARGAHVIQWTQDVYPEVAIALSPHGSVRAALRWLIPVRNWAWRHSDACVALGAEMAALLSQAAVPAQGIAVIRNWAPREVSPVDPRALRDEWGLTGRFVIGYSGNLGRVHALEPLIEIAARATRSNPRIAFVFVGGGPGRAVLEGMARSRGLEHVLFRPSQPRRRLAETLAVADVHLVTLRDACSAFVFPSKFHGILAAGRPLLFIGPPNSEIAQLVGQEQLGRAFASTDVGGAADALVALAANRAQYDDLARSVARYHHREGGFEHRFFEWHTLIQKVAQKCG